jgi:cellulose synthase/poly-beta-1,6-N-acetylglucosamine synthase-like glycosyltransferase
VLAVHNGIRLLPAKIQQLFSLDYPNLREVIVVSDGSTDGTAEFLSSQREPRLKTILLKEHSGKAVALNAGVAAATGEVVVFQDVRPELAPGAIQQLMTNFADPKVGCAAGELMLLQQGDGAPAEAVSGLYWRYEKWIRKSEACFDSPVGVSGCFYAIRRELFSCQPEGLILDDMFQPLSIIRKGYRSVFDPEAHIHDALPKKVEGEFHRKVRTLAGNFQLFQLAPWTLTPANRVFFQLFSHKVMRLVVPYLLILLLVSSAMLSPQSTVFAAITTVEAFCLLGALVSLRVQIPVLGRVLSPLTSLLVLNAAAVAGFTTYMFTRGPLWKIWNSDRTLATVPADVPDNTLARNGAVSTAAVPIADGSSCIDSH